MKLKYSNLYSYLWERVGSTAGSAIGGQNRNGWTGSHLEELMTFVVGVVLLRFAAFKKSIEVVDFQKCVVGNLTFSGLG